jgi:cell wall-associated NlpC family hydrolase
MRLRQWGALAATAAGAVGMLLAPMGARADVAAATTHVVQAGETLSQIATSSGVDVHTLVALNGLANPDLLAIGQSLKVPATATDSHQLMIAATVPGQPSGGTGSTYTVATGDTLWGIAQRTGTTPDALAHLNQLSNPNQLSVGAVLNLPSAAAAGAAPQASAQGPAAGAAGSQGATGSPQPTLQVSYTVQAGETLSQIAQRFAVSAQSVAQASGLADPDKLSVGSVLKVPVPARQHTVVAGESLRDIAAAEKVDLGSLIDFNQIDDPAMIHPGQVLVVPLSTTLQAATVPSATTPSTGISTSASTNTNPPPAAAKATPVATPATAQSRAASPTPTPSPTPAAATAKSAPAQPAASLAGVSAPPGWPSDGLAGAGLKLLGTPYVWGGASPSGFDCSGFIWYVASQVGKPVSRSMLGQYNAGSHPARADLKPGDLVFFQNTWAPGLSHSGIYLGDQKFVNAADEATGVTISSLNSAYWTTHWFGATRLL